MKSTHTPSPLKERVAAFIERHNRTVSEATPKKQLQTVDLQLNRIKQRLSPSIHTKSRRCVSFRQSIQADLTLLKPAAQSSYVIRQILNKFFTQLTEIEAILDALEAKKAELATKESLLRQKSAHHVRFQTEFQFSVDSHTPKFGQTSLEVDKFCPDAVKDTAIDFSQQSRLLLEKEEEIRKQSQNLKEERERIEELRKGIETEQRAVAEAKKELAAKERSLNMRVHEKKSNESAEKENTQSREIQLLEKAKQVAAKEKYLELKAREITLLVQRLQDPSPSSDSEGSETIVLFQDL